MSKKADAIHIRLEHELRQAAEKRAEADDVSVAHVIRQALKAFLSVALVALVLIPAASADLRMYGDARPRHFNWAREASINVPLPDQRFTILSGSDPQYLVGLREMYLPRPGRNGWSYWDERVLFLHELGHVYDFRHLNRAERNEFRAAVQTPFGWWSTKTDVPPGEMFAEEYAACALGMTRAEVEAVPSVTYGWLPDPVVEPGLCSLIRSFA